MLIGVVVALLLVPTAAGAATLYNGILGTSGHKADVTAAGQLKVADSGTVFVGGGIISTAKSAGDVPTGQINPTGSWTPFINGPQQVGAKITAINVDTWYVNPGISSAIQIGLSSDNCATVSKTVEAVNPGAVGETSIALGTDGISVEGYYVCVINDDPTNLHAAVFGTTTS